MQLSPDWSTSPARSSQVRISHWSKSLTFPRQRKQVVRTRKSNFRLSNKILDLPEITRKQLPIDFSVRCARARADAFCSLRARLYPPLWCCALVQDPHDTAGGALSSPNPPRGTRWVTLSASDMYPPLLHTLQFVAIVAPSIAPALLASSTIPPLQFSIPRGGGQEWFLHDPPPPPSRLAA